MDESPAPETSATPVGADLTGDALLGILAALANPHRLRIVALLHAQGRRYISQLAREVGISRPLLHLHLHRLEQAGLVASQMELSADGRALNYVTVTEFAFVVSPALVARAAESLTPPASPPE